MGFSSQERYKFLPNTPLCRRELSSNPLFRIISELELILRTKTSQKKHKLDQKLDVFKKYIEIDRVFQFTDDGAPPSTLTTHERLKDILITREKLLKISTWMLEYSHENPYEFTAHLKVKPIETRVTCKSVLKSYDSSDFTNRIEDELKKASMMSNFYRYMLGRMKLFGLNIVLQQSNQISHEAKAVLACKLPWQTLNCLLLPVANKGGMIG